MISTLSGGASGTWQEKGALLPVWKLLGGQKSEYDSIAWRRAPALGADMALAGPGGPLNILQAPGLLLVHTLPSPDLPAPQSVASCFLLT